MRWALQWLSGWLFLLWAIHEAGQRPAREAHEPAAVASHVEEPRSAEASPAPEETTYDDPVRCGVRRTCLAARELSPEVFEITALQVGRNDCGRLVPAFHNGRPIGLKLFSPPPSLGLQSGDTVLAVNGQRLTTPDEALAVYATLARTRRFEVDLERDGLLLKRTYVLSERLNALLDQAVY